MEHHNNLMEVRNRVAFLTHGCKYKTRGASQRSASASWLNSNVVQGADVLNVRTYLERKVLILITNADATLTVDVSESESNQSDDGKQ